MSEEQAMRVKENHDTMMVLLNQIKMNNIFIGRESEIDTLKQNVKNPDMSIVEEYFKEK